MLVPGTSIKEGVEEDTLASKAPAVVAIDKDVIDGTIAIVALRCTSLVA